jgi:hypothetical protein
VPSRTNRSIVGLAGPEAFLDICADPPASPVETFWRPPSDNRVLILAQRSQPRTAPIQVEGRMPIDGIGGDDPPA